MATEVLLPDLGLAAGEPVLLSIWFADEGDEVVEGDRLVEVLVAGSTFDVAAPATGRLSEILAFPEDELKVGQVLGIITVEESELDESGSEDLQGAA